MRRHDERDPELGYMLSEIFPAAEKELDQEAVDPFGKFLERKKARPGSTLANLAGHQGLPVGKYGKHFASKGSPPRTVAPRFVDWKGMFKKKPGQGRGRAEQGSNPIVDGTKSSRRVPKARPGSRMT